MKYISYLQVLALSLFCFTSNLDAKGSSGGFSSSSSRSSGSSWGSSSKSTATTPKAKPKATPKATPSSNSYSKPTSSYGSQAQTSTRPTSKADAARYEAASKSGKTFATRESAVADFKANNAAKMPSRYDVEPAQRPSHIPTSYADSSGTRRDVVYNQNGGGYGYYSGGGPGLGTFMLYDAMSDAAMMNTMMSRQNYYVGSAPQVSSHSSTKSGWSTVWFMGISLAGVAAIIALAFWMTR